MTDVTIYVVEYYHGLWKSYVTEDEEVVARLAKLAEHYGGKHLFNVIRLTVKPTAANMAELSCTAARVSTCDLIETVIADYPDWSPARVEMKVTMTIEEVEE
jgi:hypothetical protein